jgi:hypothetical protein
VLPAFILDDEVWVGFSEVVATDIQRAVAGRLAAAEAADAAAEADDAVTRDPDARSTLDLGPFGTLDAAAQPLMATTVRLASGRLPRRPPRGRARDRRRRARDHACHALAGGERPHPQPGRRAVMAAIALVLLTDPSIMEQLTGSLAVIGAALATVALVLLVDRTRTRQHAP